MSGPKRAYLALDACFPHDAAIEELGETHGPGGPLAIVALLCAAKRQPLASLAGEVFTSAKQLAAEAHLDDRQQAMVIVGDAHRLGLIEDLSSGDSREIHVRFPRWKDWQERQRNADNQAAARERRKP